MSSRDHGASVGTCCNTASSTCRAPADEGQAVHDIARRNRHQCILRISANPEFIRRGPATMFWCRSVARSNQRQGFPAVQVIGSTWRAAFPGQDLHRGRRSLRLKYSGDHASRPARPACRAVSCCSHAILQCTDKLGLKLTVGFVHMLSSVTARIRQLHEDLPRIGRTGPSR